LKTVFMGSPAFAVPTLDALVEARRDIQLVVTQPDRKAGRGQHMEETEIKQAARAHGLDVMDWGRGDAAAVTDRVLALEPDVIIVVAFGHILREPLLSAPRYGCINLHASLLPRWRGVSPVHYSLLHGDVWTGVSVMRMNKGVDTGPVFAQQAVAIDHEETAGELLDRLSGIGADVMLRTLHDLENGIAKPEEQNETGAVYAPKLNRSLSPVRWDKHVTTVHNQIRGLQPWPGATTFFGDRLLKITSARPWSMATPGVKPGTVVEINADGIIVACKEGLMVLTGLQNPGRKPMTADEFLRGCKVPVGTVFFS
jgi:methionyl-tRNA formyltransferase